MIAYSKEKPRFFRFIQEKITLKPNWSESTQIRSNNGCWLSFNEDGSTHIVQGTMVKPTGWRVVSREYPADLILAEKNVAAVKEAPLGELTLQTLDGEMSYNNTDGGYIVYNTYQTRPDKEDKWFMTKEVFDKKYSFEPINNNL
jgi:hypothetical protein